MLQVPIQGQEKTNVPGHTVRQVKSLDSPSLFNFSLFWPATNWMMLSTLVRAICFPLSTDSHINIIQKHPQ
jgi:hypothetical protein